MKDRRIVCGASCGRWERFYRLRFYGFALAVLAAALAINAADRHGIASWYGAECAGRLTASGERFDPSKLTCASWHYPFGARLLVTYGGRSVVVRVSDRGPAKRLNREIDLSLAAFRRLEDPAVGLIEVTVKRIK